eukprot:4820682-Alexandrium_andersonii.AAC.1
MPSPPGCAACAGARRSSAQETAAESSTEDAGRVVRVLQSSRDSVQFPCVRKRDRSPRCAPMGHAA